MGGGEEASTEKMVVEISRIGYRSATCSRAVCRFPVRLAIPWNTALTVVEFERSMAIATISSL